MSQKTKVKKTLIRSLKTESVMSFQSSKKLKYFFIITK